VKEELAFIHAAVPAGIDPSQHKFPVAGKDGSAKGNEVSDLPVKSFRELAAYNASSPVSQKNLFLIFRKQILE